MFSGLAANALHNLVGGGFRLSGFLVHLNSISVSRNQKSSVVQTLNPLQQALTSDMRSLKWECVYLNAFETGSEARAGIGSWITYYNERRPHSLHGIMTPGEAYDRRNPKIKVAA